MSGPLGKRQVGGSSVIHANSSDVHCIDDATLVDIAHGLVMCMNDVIVSFVRVYDHLRLGVVDNATDVDIDGTTVRRLGKLAQTLVTNCAELRAQFVAIPARSMNVLYSRKFQKGADSGSLVPPKRAVRLTAADALQPLYVSDQLLFAGRAGIDLGKMTETGGGVGLSSREPRTLDILENGRKCVAQLVTAAETLMCFSLPIDALTAFHAVFATCDEFVPVATSALRGI